MGGIGASLSGYYNKAQSKQNQTTKRDPIEQDIAKLLLQDYTSSREAVGGLPNYLANFAQLGNLDPRTQSYFNQATDYASQPGLNTQDYYNQALQSLNPDFYLNNARDYYSRILQPEISNQYNLLGLGRSGARQEANAKAISNISLPISQQYLNNLFNLNSSLPTVDTNLRNAQLGRFSQAAQFSDYPRQAALSANNQGASSYLSFLGNTPLAPAGTINTTGSTQGSGVKGSVSYLEK